MHSMPPLRVMPTGMRARMHFQVADQRPSFWSILLTVHTEACKRRQTRERASATESRVNLLFCGMHYKPPFSFTFCCQALNNRCHLTLLPLTLCCKALGNRCDQQQSRAKSRPLLFGSFG